MTAWGLEVDVVTCDPPQVEEVPITSYRVTFKDQVIGLVWSFRATTGIRWRARCESTIADKTIGPRKTREVTLDSLLETYLAALARDYRNMTPAERAEVILPSPRKARERAFAKLIHDLGGGTPARKLAAEVRRFKVQIGRWLMADADVDERVKLEQSARARARLQDIQGDSREDLERVREDDQRSSATGASARPVGAHHDHDA